jgi:transcriptional regulator
MYVPKHFAEQRLEVLHEAINHIAFGSLITLTAGAGAAPVLAVSHIPMHVEPRSGTHGVLCGHLARANPQWRDIQPGVAALATFVGAEAYISPSLYATKKEHGRVVPTWDYIAVHASGAIEFFDDPARLHALVSLLTDAHESDRFEPWHVDDAPDAYIADQLKGIVGFEMPITEIAGKWKLSQNKPLEDRIGVEQGLLESDDEGAREIARAVRETLQTSTS